MGEYQGFTGRIIMNFGAYHTFVVSLLWLEPDVLTRQLQNDGYSLDRFGTVAEPVDSAHVSS